MNGDIKSNVKILKYPKIEVFDNITGEEIIKYVEDHQDLCRKFRDNQDYYIGKNVSINKKRNVSKENPDSRVTTPYARSMTQIVKGYMYKPGLITYHSKNEAYLEKIMEIFDRNDEELVTSELGENQSKYGIGIELMYIENDSKPAIPGFININPDEVILLYDMKIKPSLIGAIRYYLIKEDHSKHEKTYMIEVYFIDRVEIYEMIENNQKKEVSELQSFYENIYKKIPFNVYINNQEYLADYESVITLIDAYDILMSDGINELNRFASAYLLLYNYIIANVENEAEKQRKLEQIKAKRVFEFLTDGTAKTGAEFLTKDIPTEFMLTLRNTLREDIEYHSHIPDFRSESFQAKSGTAMLYSLFDFENLCGDKQAYFERGLKQRIELINIILKIKANDIDKIEIKFERNRPADMQAIINAFVQLASTGKIPDEILLKMLPSDIIEDVGEALELLKKQKEENASMFNIDMQEDQNNEEEKNKNDTSKI